MLSAAHYSIASRGELTVQAALARKRAWPRVVGALTVTELRAHLARVYDGLAARADGTRAVEHRKSGSGTGGND